MDAHKIIDLTRFATILLAAIVVALATFVWNANDRLGKIEEANKIHEEQEETHDELEERIRKFWALHHWSKDEINYLRSLHDLSMSQWHD